MSATRRLKSVTRALTRQEAQSIRDADTKAAADLVQQALRDLLDLIDSPLPQTTQEYQEMHPDDPDYENAPFQQTVVLHGGVFKTLIPSA